MKLLAPVFLFVIGIQAIPIAEDVSTKNEFGSAITKALNQIKDSIGCLKESKDYISISEQNSSHVINLDLSNWKLDWNVKNLRVYGLEKFEVVKSKYDENSRRYELEVTFDGPRFEGSYSIMNNASDSRFDVDFDGYLNFKVKTHPAVVKIGWTFGTNETTNGLTIEDLKLAVTPLIDNHKSIFDKLFEDGTQTDLELRKDLKVLFNDYYKMTDEAGGEILQAFLEEVFEEFKSVDELTQVIHSIVKKIFNFSYGCLDLEEE